MYTFFFVGEGKRTLLFLTSSSLTPEDRKSITDECWRKARKKKRKKGHADMNESLYTYTYPCSSSVECSTALKRGSPRSSSTTTSTLAGCMCSIIGTSCAPSSPRYPPPKWRGVFWVPENSSNHPPIFAWESGVASLLLPHLGAPSNHPGIIPPSSTLLSSRHPRNDETK